MSRTLEPTDFSVPPALARRVEKLARQERRTPAALLREMLSLYERYKQQDEPYSEAWALRLMREAREEDRVHPLTPEEDAREEAELNRYAEAQTRKVGIKEKDIPQRIEAARARRRKHAGRARQ